MTDRDRLIELLFKVTKEKDCPQPCEVADYLLANGVTLGKPLVEYLHPIDAYEGLKGKYLVFKADTGEQIVNCFVLRPDKDNIAVEALRFYAYTTENKTLAEDIYKWVGKSEILPPCKVGAEIFGIFDNDDEQRKEIYEGKILCYSLDENNLLWARMRYKNGLTYWHTIDDFGKTVFLNKEEAEANLKECEKE